MTSTTEIENENLTHTLPGTFRSTRQHHGASLLRKYIWIYVFIHMYVYVYMYEYTYEYTYS